MSTKIYVWATDKCLSNWGKSEGQICKQVVVCENWEQAEKIINGFESSPEFKNVNFSSKRPSFSGKRYNVTFRDAVEFTRFLK